MSASILPALNAMLNATSACLLIVGLAAIRRKQVGVHTLLMLGALAVSAVFLVSYVLYHVRVGSVPFQGAGWIRPVYFSILISHTVLAVVIVPLALRTLWLAVRRRFDQHVALARWTLPLWLYVSVTGVFVYWMLYQ